MQLDFDSYMKHSNWTRVETESSIDIIDTNNTVIISVSNTDSGRCLLPFALLAVIMSDIANMSEMLQERQVIAELFGKIADEHRN